MLCYWQIPVVCAPARPAAAKSTDPDNHHQTVLPLSLHLGDGRHLQPCCSSKHTTTAHCPDCLAKCSLMMQSLAFTATSSPPLTLAPMHSMPSQTASANLLDRCAIQVVPCGMHAAHSACHKSGSNDPVVALHAEGSPWAAERGLKRLPPPSPAQPRSAQGSNGRPGRVGRAMQRAQRAAPVPMADLAVASPEAAPAQLVSTHVSLCNTALQCTPRRCQHVRMLQT